MRSLALGIATSALVTGSTGFVGKSLCRLLVDRGWKVVGVSRRPSEHGIKEGFHNACLPLMSDVEGWQRSLFGIQCVVHLAAQVHQFDSSTKAATAFYEINVEGSKFVAEQAARAGVRRFIFLSSIKVNGEGGDSRTYRGEDIPSPVDAYGRSKMIAEVELKRICSQWEMELVVIRPPLVYGPSVRANFRRLIQLAALGVPLPLRSIQNRRSLVSVWNLADFVELCMLHPDSVANTWLISDGEDLSTPDLVKRLSLLLERPCFLFSVSPRWLKRIATVVGFRREADSMCDTLRVDINPALTRLGWNPLMRVDAALALTVADYRANRLHGR
jgi:nucleoside-diphosphate-sugar epimerase